MLSYLLSSGRVGPSKGQDQSSWIFQWNWSVLSAPTTISRNSKEKNLRATSIKIVGWCCCWSPEVKTDKSCNNIAVLSPDTNQPLIRIQNIEFALFPLIPKAGKWRRWKLAGMHHLSGRFDFNLFWFGFTLVCVDKETFQARLWKFWSTLMR